jgi:hypothetical protein
MIMLKSSTLSHRLVLTMFNYDPITGVMTRRFIPGHSITPGRIVGTRNDNLGNLLVTINHRHYILHCLIWFYVLGRWPAKNLIHVNGNLSDNRAANIRPKNCQYTLAQFSKVV